jgi:hypothetical protein
MKLFSKLKSLLGLHNSTAKQTTRGTIESYSHKEEGSSINEDGYSIGNKGLDLGDLIAQKQPLTGIDERNAWIRNVRTSFRTILLEYYEIESVVMTNKSNTLETKRTLGSSKTATASRSYYLGTRPKLSYLRVPHYSAVSTSKGEACLSRSFYRRAATSRNPSTRRVA